MNAQGANRRPNNRKQIRMKITPLIMLLTMPEMAKLVAKSDKYIAY